LVTRILHQSVWDQVRYAPPVPLPDSQADQAVFRQLATKGVRRVVAT
jgi:hypothetical protein